MKRRQLILLFTLLTALLLGTGWLLLRSRDPLFHGKPESVWIANLAYNDDEQTKQWKGFGPEGVRVLVHGFNKANRPWERAYRRVYRKIPPALPSRLVSLLPAPAMDLSRSTRMRVVSLLSAIGDDAELATPALENALKDEDSGVRQLAITFFTRGEDSNAPLNRLPHKIKNRLLPRFLDALQGRNQGLRNNAALALRYYPEQAEVVAPALIKALSDPDPKVQLLAAQSLHQIAPEKIVPAGVVPITTRLLKNRDDQIAHRAAQLLGLMRKEPAVAVPALIEASESTSVLVASCSLSALGNFPEQSDLILPVLKKASENPEPAIRRSALDSLKKIAPGQKDEH